MKIVCKANKIYVRFTSNSKTIEKSLKMDVCEKNLKFVNDVLLPIFEKIRCERKIKTKKILYSGAKNIKKFDIKTHKIIRNPHTLGDFCTIVFDNISQNRKISTIKTAENAINRFFDFINDKKIADYKIYELQEIVTQMQKNLAASSIKTIFCYIKQAFNEALKNDIITKNPVNFVIFPKIVREKKEILTLDDVVKIFDNAGGELKNFGNRIFYGSQEWRNFGTLRR